MSRFGSHNILPKIETGSMTKANEQCLVYNVFIVVGVLLSWTLRDKKCNYNNTHTVWVGLEIDINHGIVYATCMRPAHCFLSFVEVCPKLIDYFLTFDIFSINDGTGRINCLISRKDAVDVTKKNWITLIRTHFATSIQLD